MKQTFYLFFVFASLPALSTAQITVKNNASQSYSTRLKETGGKYYAKGGPGNISGTSTVCVGSTTTLNSSVSGGSWSSSKPAVATISAAGIVTGITAGTSTISYKAGSSPAATQVVTVYAMPSPVTISGASTVAAGNTLTLTSSATGGSWSSSATSIAKVSSSGIVTGQAAGTATISYVVSNICGTSIATTAISVTPGDVPISPKIPMNGKRWYLLNNCSNGLEGLHDSNLAALVTTGSGKILSSYDAYYPVLPGEQINITGIRFFSPTGSSFSSQALKLYYIDSLWRRVLIGTYQGGSLNKWVGPNPTYPSNINLSTPVNIVKYLLISCNDIFPNELELFGSYTPPTATPPIPIRNIKLKQELGVNAFEWDFLNSTNPLIVDEPKMKAINSFRGVRHYLDWEKLEPTSGGYTFNPSHSGGWNLDAMYTRAKADGVEILADIKTIPPWIQSTYTSSNRDNENTPINSSGLDFTKPGSYSKQAKVAFQFAARYGYNTAVNPSLVSVDASKRWTGDSINKVKIGLGLIRYIECDNERDKTWKGRKAYQTGREYAANLSAFYDGHKNTMGPGVGVKNADPSMQVVMCGIALPYTDYVRGMVDWCKEFRGYKADGSADLCWDVINYHVFPNDKNSAAGFGTRGKAADVARVDTFATNLIKVAHELAHDMPVWITETGYDVSQTSPVKAIPIGSKSVEQVRADWILRHALQNARLGIERTFFYILYADDLTSSTPFASSGLINPSDRSRKPPADYLFQANRLMAEYVFKETISTNPYVDRYELAGQSIYVMVKASEDGSTVPYTLKLNPAVTIYDTVTTYDTVNTYDSVTVYDSVINDSVTIYNPVTTYDTVTTYDSVIIRDSATIYTPAIGKDSMNGSTMTASDSGALALTVSETPIFVVPRRRLTAASKIPSYTVNVPHKTIHENAILKESDVNVFPNPTTSNINLCIDNMVESNVNIAIYNQDGRICKRTSFSKSPGKVSRTIDISTLPYGFYIIEVEQKNEKVFKKIIKVNQ
jgi:hypothetical protein